MPEPSPERGSEDGPSHRGRLESARYCPVRQETALFGPSPCLPRKFLLSACSSSGVALPRSSSSTELWLERVFISRPGFPQTKILGVRTLARRGTEHAL